MRLEPDETSFPTHGIVEMMISEIISSLLMPDHVALGCVGLTFVCAARSFAHLAPGQGQADPDGKPTNESESKARRLSPALSLVFIVAPGIGLAASSQTSNLLHADGQAECGPRALLQLWAGPIAWVCHKNAWQVACYEYRQDDSQ